MDNLPYGANPGMMPPADVGSLPPSVNMNVFGATPPAPSASTSAAPQDAMPGLGSSPPDAGATVYGTPTPAPGGGTAYPMYQTPPGGGPLMYKGHQVKVTEHPNLGNAPTFPEYVIQEMLSSKDHNTTANMSDTDIMMLAEPFARQFAGTYNAQGVEMNKKEEDALVGQFKHKVFKYMPQLRKDIADAEAAHNAKMGTAATPAMGVPTALGTRALGSMETGAGNVAAGLPGLAAKIPGMIVPPGLKGVADEYLPELSAKAKQAEEGIRSTFNPLIQPGAAALKKSGEETVQSTDEALKEHPYLAATSEVLGGAAPYLALGATTGMVGPALYGMSEMGGASLQEEQDRINKMKPEELNALPEYQTLLKATGDPTKAKDLLAKASSEAAEEVGQIMGGVMGSIGGGGMSTPAQRVIAKAVGTSTLKRVLATAGAEATGFASQQAVKNVLTTQATNVKTGEKREPDALAGTDQAGIMGAVMGAIGSLIHGKAKLTKAGTTTPAATGAIPEAATKAYEEVLAHPDYKVPEGASPEAANNILKDGLDELEARLGGHGLSEEQINNAKKSFEAEWRKANDQPAPIGETAEPTKTEAGAAVTPVAAPVDNNLAIARLQKQHDAAVKSGDTHAASQLKRQMAELQAQGSAGGGEPPPPPGGGVAGGEAVGGEAPAGFTRSMMIELQRLGFTQEQAYKLTPAEAWDHIHGNAGPEATVPATTERAKDEVSMVLENLKKRREEIVARLKANPGDAAHLQDSIKRIGDMIDKLQAEMGGMGKEAPAATGAAPKVVSSFRTAKGSTYDVHEDGTTTRNKAARPEHPGEEGPQARSHRTVYVTELEAEHNLSGQQTEYPKAGLHIFRMPNGETYVGVRNLEGPDAGKVRKNSLTKFRTKPEVGLIPVEMWNDGQHVHFGNKITEVGGGKPAGAGATAGEGAGTGAREGGAAPVEPMGQATGHPHNKPAAPAPAPDHHTITHPDVDIRHPLGLLKAALNSFRATHKREPTRVELENESKKIALLHGVDLDNPDHDVNRREALGELLDENPDVSPSPNDITTRAGQYLDQANKRTAHSAIAERIGKRDEHPIVKFRRVMEKTNRLLAEKARKEAERKDVLRKEAEAKAKQEAEDEEAKQRQAEYEKQLPKVDSELTAEEESAARESDLVEYRKNLKDQQQAEHEAQLAKEHADQVKADLKKRKEEKKGNVLKQTLAEKKIADKQAALAKELEAKAQKKKNDATKARKKSQAKAADIKKAPRKDVLKKQPPAPKKTVPKKGKAGAAAKTKSVEPVGKLSAKLEPERKGGFYSRLAKTLENSDLKFNSLTANAWKRWLNDAERRGDIKKSEREWLGIDQWLDRESGPVIKGTGKDQPTVAPTISRWAVRDFLAAHDLKITAETRGDMPKITDLPRGWYTKYGRYADVWEVRDNHGDLKAESEEGGSEDDAITVALNDLNETRGLEYPPTGDSTYLSTPGGKNHKEVFLTIPTSAAKNKIFRSTHFKGVVNAILHLRTNERLTRDGKKMLFADEIQNEWAKALSDYKGILKEKIKDWTAKEDGPKDEDGIQSYRVYDNNGTFKEKIIARSPQKAIERVAERDFIGTGTKRPPDAPFTNPSDYFLLGIKHMLSEAIKNGQDKIGWTTGEQQTHRYGLSRKVHSISVRITPAGERIVDVRMKNNDLIALHVNKDGIVTFSPLKSVIPNGVKLENVIGKSLTEKVMAAEHGANFSGENLDLGGQFHRNLYDKIGPKAVADYIKQWGGKVETSETKTRSRDDFEVKGVSKGSKGNIVSVKDKSNGLSYTMPESHVEGFIHNELKGGDITVHSFDITPEMREAIKGKEQPAFAERDTTGREGGEKVSGIRPGLMARSTVISDKLTDHVKNMLGAKNFKAEDIDKMKFETVDDKSLSPELQSVVQRWGEATGHRIIVFRNLAEKVFDFEGANFHDGNLYVNENSTSPATAIASHEFLHQLKKDNPALYKELRDEVVRQGKIKEYTKRLQGAREYDTMSEEGATEELVANATGEAFTNKEFLDKLAQRNPTVFGKIVDAFMKFLDKLFGKKTWEADLGTKDYLTDVAAFRNKLLDTLEKYHPEDSTMRRLYAAKAPKETVGKLMARRGPTITTAAEAAEAAEDWTKKKPGIVQSFKTWKDASDTLKPSLWQKIIQKGVNSIQPLQYYNEYMARQGNKVDPTEDMFKYFTVLRGRQIFEQSTDHSNYIAPILDAARVMSGKHNMTEDEFMGRFSQWIRAKDALESNKRYELENIKLSPEAEKKRAPLLQEVRDDKFTGDYMRELTKIVHAPGAKQESHVEPVSGITNAVAHQIISNVNKEGFSNDIGEEFNKSFDKLRERIIENQRRANSLSEADIRQQKAYGNRYYMPKSDWADEDIRVPNNVFGSPLGSFTKSLYGEQPKLSDDPIHRIFNKLLFSSKDVADNEATGALWRAAKNPDQKLGATIHRFDMDDMAKDALAGGRKLGAMKRVAAGRNAVIHNEGKYRYVITLPEESAQLQAIKESQHPVALGDTSAMVGKATAAYGRVHTAFSLPFALVNSVVRDGLYIPSMMVSQGRTDLIPGYIANYMKFGGPFGAWASAFKLEGGLKVKTFADVEKYALANPDSYLGQLYQLDKAGGGFNFRDSFNNAKTIQGLREELEKAKLNPLNPRRITKYLAELQDAIATGSMMAGRVASFISAKDSGMKPIDAAFYAKRLLDYQQTSQGSRVLNSWFAFARVGVTSLDVMLSTLKNEKGQLDAKRAAMAMGVFGLATASAYTALKTNLGDDKIKKISDDDLAKNVILPFGGDDPLKLPIGLGMPRLSWGVAMLATRLASGDTTIQSAGRTLKNLLAENVSPLHPIETKEGEDSGTIAADLAGGLVPSVARPGYESFLNQTAFGSEIHEKPAYTQGYASEAARATTGKMYTTMARALREYTGLDMYPETLRHLMSSYDPGTISLLFKGVEKEDMETAGLDVDNSQATIFAGLFNHDLRYAAGKEYYRSKQTLEQAKKEKDFLEKQGKTVPSDIQTKADLDKEFVKASKEHSKDRRAITDNNLLGTTAKTSRLAALQSQWAKTQENFSKQAARLEH